VAALEGNCFIFLSIDFGFQVRKLKKVRVRRPKALSGKSHQRYCFVVLMNFSPVIQEPASSLLKADSDVEELADMFS
jgi:hypothetical protein